MTTRAMVGQSAYAMTTWPGEEQWMQLQAEQADLPIPNFRPTVVGAGGAVLGYLVGGGLLSALAGGAAGFVGYLIYDAYQVSQDGLSAIDPSNWKPIRPRA